MKQSLIISILLLAGCTGQMAKNGTTATQAAQTVQPDALPRFTTPPVPDTLTTPEQRAEFVVSHYWDLFNFADTTLIAREEYTEQAFVDFVNILPHVSLPLASKGLEILMHKAEADSAMYLHFMGLSEKYYYEPNSPFRSEELYIVVLRSIIASKQLAEIEKVRPQYQLTLALKNRVGERATNFTYTTLQGGKAKLYAATGDRILLFFYRPDCETCKATKLYVAEKEIDKLATIVWVNPDQDTHLDEIYDLRASPTLYLLDGKHTVLLKDVPIEQIENYLKTAPEK